MNSIIEIDVLKTKEKTANSRLLETALPPTNTIFSRF